MAQESLSLRAYAAHRRALGLSGGSLQAVQRAIRGERISYVLENSQKRIPDPDAADREWAANTDLSRASGDIKELGDELDGELDFDEEGAPRGSLSKASAEEKRWKAKSARLKYEKDAGELVHAAEVEAAIVDDYTTVRTRLLGLPSRAKQRLSHLTLDDLATLEELVREDLEALAEPEEDS